MTPKAQVVIQEGQEAFFQSLTPREREVVDILKDTMDIYSGYDLILKFKYQRVEDMAVSYSKAGKDSRTSLEETVAVIVITPTGVIEMSTTDDISEDCIDAMVQDCLDKADETNYGNVEKVKLDSVEPNIRTYNVEEGIPFDSMSFDDKVALFEEILAKIDVEEDGVKYSGRINYGEIVETRIIVDSYSTLVKDRRPLPRFAVSITGEKKVDKKNTLKDTRYGLNGMGGLEVTIRSPELFKGIEKSKAEVLEIFKEISFEEYLKREGLDESILNNARIVLGPGFFSTVMHEAFGHPLSEADKYVTGNSFACVDGKVNPMQVAVPGFSAAFVSNETTGLCRGTRFVDDDGTHVEKIYVIKDGWVGRDTELLHSQYTATKQGTTSKGTCVSWKGYQIPIPRQCKMAWEIDESKIPSHGAIDEKLTIGELDNMAQASPEMFFGEDGTKTVIYIDGSKGGEALSASGTFSLNSNETYILRQGEEPVRLNPLTVKGQVQEFLKDNIKGFIGCKGSLLGGSCGRGQSYEKVQWNPDVTTGNNAVIINYHKNKMTFGGTR